MQQPIIALDQVTKFYGDSRGVEKLTFSVKAGEVFGFLGPNGAGKSTTIHMLMNLTTPTSGVITLFGQNNQQHGLEARRRIGYLAGDMELDGALTGKQQLEYFAHIRGGVDWPYVEELSKKLQAETSKKIRTLSRGNKQKIGLLTALMHKPELIILDEPTSGLDPLVQDQFAKLILEHKAAGGTTFISSHVLSEVQELCDRVAFIREGKLIVNKPLKDIVRGAPKIVSLVSSHPNVAKELKSLKGISSVSTQGKNVSAHYLGDVTALLRRLANLDLEDVTVANADLDSIFTKYYEGDHV